MVDDGGRIGPRRVCGKAVRRCEEQFVRNVEHRCDPASDFIRGADDDEGFDQGVRHRINDLLGTCSGLPAIHEPTCVVTDTQRIEERLVLTQRRVEGEPDLGVVHTVVVVIGDDDA